MNFLDKKVEFSPQIVAVSLSVTLLGFIPTNSPHSILGGL